MSDLMRVTFNLTPRAAAELEDLVHQTGDNRTDVLIAAVGLYRALLPDLHRLCVDEGDGRITRIRVIGAGIPS